MSTMPSSRAGDGGSPDAPVGMVVEYDDPDDLLADHAHTLGFGGTVVATARAIDLGAPVRLTLQVPGLLAPIVLAGTATSSCGDGGGDVVIEFHAADVARLGDLVARIRAGDPAVVAPLARVLVAEDNPHLSNLICSGLIGSAKRAPAGRPRYQFNFHVVEDGRRAMDVLGTRKFDVAIIDIYLPSRDGAQVIAAARAGRDPTLPIIACSAGGPIARELAMAAGADVFLDKPVRLRELFDTVVALVERRVPVAAAAAPTTQPEAR